MAGMWEMDKAIKAALEEDIGAGDITGRLVVGSHREGKAVITAKSDCVLAGVEWARRTFELVDRRVEFRAVAADGNKLSPGDVIARLRGSYRSLLAGERTALNFLQRASGIAALTARYVEKVEGTAAVILDTRKTAPGLRALDKAAVAAGGGVNHRNGLFDGILIKDNHIKAAGGIADAVELALAGAGHLMRVEVEVKNLDELSEALDAGADVVMLDNMSLEDIRKAVETAGEVVLLEVSGNVSLENVADIAAAGVDFISVGALTHSAPAADIAMDVELD